MSEDKVEFKWLEAKSVGTDTVVFRLEDGAMVKLRVDITRAGVATNFKNPDGSPHYSINTNVGIQIIPADKRFTLPKSQVIREQPQQKERTIKPI
jgi:hypothetical protein